MSDILDCIVTYVANRLAHLRTRHNKLKDSPFRMDKVEDKYIRERIDELESIEDIILGRADR